MESSVSVELDLIEEFRLRRWAREHYVAQDQRLSSWHPIVLEEMVRKERDVIGSGTMNPMMHAAIA